MRASRATAPPRALVFFTHLFIHVRARSFYSRMLQRAGSTNSSGSLTLLALMEPMVDVIDAAAPASASYAVETFGVPAQDQKRVELLAEKGIELTDEVLAKLEITPLRRNTAEGRAAMDVSEVLTSVATAKSGLAPDEAAPDDAATPRVIIDPCRRSRASASAARCAAGAPRPAGAHAPRRWQLAAASARGREGRGRLRDRSRPGNERARMCLGARHCSARLTPERCRRCARSQSSQFVLVLSRSASLDAAAAIVTRARAQCLTRRARACSPRPNRFDREGPRPRDVARRIDLHTAG